MTGAPCEAVLASFHVSTDSNGDWGPVAHSKTCRFRRYVHPLIQRWHKVLAMTEAPPALGDIYDGWARHQSELIRVLTPLTAEQLALREVPEHWAIWQLASNMAGGRA